MRNVKRIIFIFFVLWRLLKIRKNIFVTFMNNFKLKTTNLLLTTFSYHFLIPFSHDIQIIIIFLFDNLWNCSFIIFGKWKSLIFCLNKVPSIDTIAKFCSERSIRFKFFIDSIDPLSKYFIVEILNFLKLFRIYLLS